jgi:hypothetical protein
VDEVGWAEEVVEEGKIVGDFMSWTLNYTGYSCSVI